MVVRDIGRGAAALMIVAEEITVGAATEIIAVEYRGRRDGRLTQHHYPHSRVLAADSGAEGRSARLTRQSRRVTGAQHPVRAMPFDLDQCQRCPREQRVSILSRTNGGVDACRE